MSIVPSGRARPSRADFEAPTQLELKTLVVRMDPELHQEFQIYAIRSGSNMAAIVRDHIKSLVQP